MLLEPPVPLSWLTSPLFGRYDYSFDVSSVNGKRNPKTSAGKQLSLNRHIQGG
jgi:hypothetical protein